jgi:cytoskeletal protein CcmA (bactofilin family)
MTATHLHRSTSKSARRARPGREESQVSTLFGRRPTSVEVLREPTETVISAGTIVTGALRSSDGVRVDGRVEGPVQSEAAIVVGPDGVINGDVIAVNVHIAGTVHGRVRAEYRLELAATGELHGDVEVARLAIQDGALFLGQVIMREPPGGVEEEEEPFEEPDQRRGTGTKD